MSAKIKTKNLPDAPSPKRPKPNPEKVEDIGHRNKRLAMMAKAQQDREKIYKLYRKGVPRSDIARIVGVEKGTVIGAISRGFRDGDLKEYVVSYDEKLLIRLYEKGLTYQQLGVAMGTTEGTVSGMLGRLRMEGLIGYRAK